MTAVRSLLEALDLLAPDVVLPHQAFNALMIHMKSAFLQRLSDSPNAVGLSRVRHYIADLSDENSVRFIIIGVPFSPLLVALWNATQNAEHCRGFKDASVLMNPCVLHGWFCAKYLAAFFRMSASSWSRAFSFLRRLFSSSRFTSPTVALFFFLDSRPHVWTCQSERSSSLATCEAPLPTSTRRTALSLNS